MVNYPHVLHLKRGKASRHKLKISQMECLLKDDQCYERSLFVAWVVIFTFETDSPSKLHVSTIPNEVVPRSLEALHL